MTRPLKTISFIGAGNVAWHLGKALSANGFIIREICSLNQVSASELALELQAQPVKGINYLDGLSDLYIIAVTDSAISIVAESLNLHDKIVVHTAGSVSMETLGGVSSRYGVLYPLQTFSRNVEVNFSEVPLCLEASDDAAMKLLQGLAGKITRKVVPLSSRDRMVLHIAAVFASNYANHLYTLAESLLQDRNISFSILEPLIRETTRKALIGGPSASQTGPARRNDLKVIDSHLEYLATMPEFAEIYRLLAESIRRRYHS